jgi:SnoaL-like protein
MNSRHVPSLPEPIAAFVAATNSLDLDALLATFVDDALVNDQFQEYWGKPAICIWAMREIIDSSLHMTVVDSSEHYGHVIVRANIDGSFDKRGLPDPLQLDFYFSARDDKIVQLIILRNQSGT